MKRASFVLLSAMACMAAGEPQTALLDVKRVYVDKLTGESSAQIRDMIINALQTSTAFTITENIERADAYLRGSAEDLIFTDTFQSSEGVNARASLGLGSGASKTTASRRGALSVGVGEDESVKIAERKHEAMAAVRLVSKDGDVIWSTTQESGGAKFRSASADVAEKVIRQLLADLERARRPKISETNPGGAPLPTSR